MNQKQSYQLLADRLGIKPELLPFLVEVGLDLTVINPILPETIRRLGPILDLRPGMRILDLGCGKGGVSLPLVHTYKVGLVGLDLMPDFIREAWSRAEYSGIYELCDFRYEDAARFAAETKEQWDTVLIIGALTMIWNDMEAGLEAAGPLVRPGGHLVIGHPYRLEGGEEDPDEPLMSKEETTARLGRVGELAEVLDDGDEGWEAYSRPQVKSMERLREKNPDNEQLLAFLDEWTVRMDWERKNLGFALWVLRVGHF